MRQFQKDGGGKEMALQITEMIGIGQNRQAIVLE